MSKVAKKVLLDFLIPDLVVYNIEEKISCTTIFFWRRGCVHFIDNGKEGCFSTHIV